MQAATKSFTFYLADAADPATAAAQAPPGFLARAARPDNIYGLPPNATQFLAIPANGSSGGCPAIVDGVRSKYCWSLNWNLFTPPSHLAILDVATMAAGATVPYTGSTYGVRLDLGDVVDLALVNPSMMVHPMHLHGTVFWVLASGNGRITDDQTDQIDWDRVAALAASKRGGYNPLDPPLRDMTPVPQAVGSTPDGYGYTVVRFVASSPGVFAFHCHTDLHSASGMMMFFVVGVADVNSSNSTSGGHGGHDMAAGGMEEGMDMGSMGGAGGGSSSSSSNNWYVPSNLTCGTGAGGGGHGGMGMAPGGGAGSAPMGAGGMSPMPAHTPGHMP